MRRTNLLLPLALLLAAVAAPLHAQGAVVDEGTFQVFADGKPVGTEEFTIRQSGSGANVEVIATGHVRLNLPDGSLGLLPRLRATGLKNDPVGYEVTVEGTSPRKIVGSIGSGRFSARTLTGSGEQLREYVASSGAVILDDNVAHHLYFLAMRARSGRVPVIVPRQNRQVIATVTDRGEERVNVAGQNLTLYHLVVHPAGADARHVWVDSLNRVIKVEVPDQGYSAVRTAIPQ